MNGMKSKIELVLLVALLSFLLTGVLIRFIVFKNLPAPDDVKVTQQIYEEFIQTARNSILTNRPVTNRLVDTMNNTNLLEIASIPKFSYTIICINGNISKTEIQELDQLGEQISKKYERKLFLRYGTAQ
jgi:hypothetical protein